MRALTLAALMALAPAAAAAGPDNLSPFWKATRTYEERGATWQSTCLSEPQPHCVRWIESPADEPGHNTKPYATSEAFFVITPGKGVKGKVAHVSCIWFSDKPDERDCGSWDDWYKGPPQIHQERRDGDWHNTPWPY